MEILSPEYIQSFPKQSVPEELKLETETPVPHGTADSRAFSDDEEPLPLAFNARLLRVLGAAPGGGGWRRARLGCVCAVLLGQQVCWVSASAAGDAAAVAEAMGVGLLGLSSNVAFGTLAWGAARLLALRRALRACPAPPDQLRALERRMRTVTLAFLTAYSVAGVGMTSLPWLVPVGTESELPPLPLPIHFPLDYSRPAGYAFTLAFQLLIQVVYAAVIPIAGCAMVALMAHTALRLRAVAAQLLALGGDAGGGRAVWAGAGRRLRDCIRQHQAALALAEEVERFLRFPMGVQLLCSSIMFCAMANQITRGAESLHVPVREGALLVPLVVQLFAYCFMAEVVRTEGQAVAAAAWNCGWEQGAPVAFRRDLLLVLLRAQRPTRLTAMRVADLSLFTFGEVMKLSYSYYNLLNESNN